MVSTSDKSGTGRIRRKRTKGAFKGVRMRKWGKWVSEIRVPQSRSRIWLGSYDSEEKAARAYDAALYCLRGSQGNFNFPNELPELPDGSSTSYSKTEIKAVALRFASSSSLSVPSTISSLTSTTSTPEAPITAGETSSSLSVPSTSIPEAPTLADETSSSLSVPSTTSSIMSTTSSPEAPISAAETGSTCGAGDSHCAAGVVDSDMFSPETFLWEELIMLDPDWIRDILDRNY